MVRIRAATRITDGGAVAFFLRGPKHLGLFISRANSAMQCMDQGRRDGSCYAVVA